MEIKEVRPHKITILAEHAWLIRCVTVKLNAVDPSKLDIVETRYMETPAIWNKSPIHSTIFHGHESAENMIKCYEIFARNMIKNYRPETEIIDVVSWIDEAMHNPAGITLEVKDGKIRRIT